MNNTKPQPICEMLYMLANMYNFNVAFKVKKGIIIIPSYSYVLFCLSGLQIMICELPGVVCM